MDEAGGKASRDPRQKKARDLARQLKIASNNSDKAARRHACTVRGRRRASVLGVARNRSTTEMRGIAARLDATGLHSLMHEAEGLRRLADHLDQQGGPSGTET